MAASDASAARAVCVENATIGELRQALSTGDATAAGLVEAYVVRIAGYDRAGPRLDAVREVNPDAPAIADALRTFRRDLNIVLSRGVWRIFAVTSERYRRTLDARALLDFSGVLERAVELLKQMDEFARSRQKSRGELCGVAIRGSQLNTQTGP